MQPLHVGAAMIVTLKQMYPQDLRFVPPNHEKGDFTLDLLWGSDSLRTQITLCAQAFAEIDRHTQEMRSSIVQSFILDIYGIS